MPALATSLGTTVCNAIHGTVKFSGRVADLADEKRHAELPRISIPARNHQPRRMAVPSILCELSRCRRIWPNAASRCPTKRSGFGASSSARNTLAGSSVEQGRLGDTWRPRWARTARERSPGAPDGPGSRRVDPAALVRCGWRPSGHDWKACRFQRRERKPRHGSTGYPENGAIKGAVNLWTHSGELSA